jgi:hypothetical protein
MNFKLDRVASPTWHFPEVFWNGNSIAPLTRRATGVHFDRGTADGQAAWVDLRKFAKLPPALTVISAPVSTTTF